jgi:nitrous oxidase accessory protein NosD
MQIAEARKILGLEPDEDPRPHLAEFRRVRERLAAVVREAPNESLAMRFQHTLVEIDQALAAVREHLEILGLYSQPAPLLPELPAAIEPIADAPETPVRRGRGRAVASVFLLLLMGAAVASWMYLKGEEDKRLDLQVRLVRLEREGGTLIEERRWPEAARKFLEIDSLQPGSEVARIGRRSIEAGMVEELNQSLAYWKGEARAALDGSRWDDAEKAIRKVLDRYPDEEESLAILDELRIGREAATLNEAIDAARALLAESEWDAAVAAAEAILAEYPGEEGAASLLADVLAAKEKMAADLLRARELFEMAAPRDKGVFDQEALDWLREAAALAPEDPLIAAALEKISAYVRTLRVPGDFATPAEALAAARDGDRIVVAKGSWEGPLLVDAAIELQGASAATSIIFSEAGAGCAITFGPQAAGAQVIGFGFQHRSFDDSAERFSAVQVRGGDVIFTDCQFSDASGHGLVVVEGGKITASRCRFVGNAWNGVAAMGEGTLLELRDCEATGNFGHGIEAWDGASIILSRNRCEQNSRNGIHADGGTASATIEGNQLVGNREFGLVLGRVASGRVAENVARGNLLGGFVIHSTASAVSVVANQAVKNEGPGLVLEAGLNASLFTQNVATGNQRAQVLPDADFTPPPEVEDDSALSAEEIPDPVQEMYDPE